MSQLKKVKDTNQMKEQGTVNIFIVNIFYCIPYTRDALDGFLKAFLKTR